MIKYYNKLFVITEQKRKEFVALMEFIDYREFESKIGSLGRFSGSNLSNFWSEFSYKDDLYWILIKSAAIKDYSDYSANYDVDQILSEILGNFTNRTTAFYSIVYDSAILRYESLHNKSRLQYIRNFHQDESLINDELAVVLNLQTKMLYLTSLGGFLSRAREI